MGKNMCLKCREKVIYKVYHNLQQHENLNLWNKVVCLLSIYLFRKRQFIIILNKMKNFILRTKFKSNLCRLSIFCNMREKFIFPPFQWMGGYTLLLLDNPIPNVFYKKKWIALQSVFDGTSPFLLDLEEPYRHKISSGWGLMSMPF